MIKQLVLSPSIIAYNIYLEKYQLSRVESVLVTNPDVSQVMRGRQGIDLVLLNGWYNHRDWEEVMYVYNSIITKRFCVQLFDYNLDPFPKERKEKWLEDTNRIVTTS
jgi:hypothetical protein